MAEAAPKIRLFVDAALQAEAMVTLSGDQAHYLAGVMRRRPGDSVALFNGRDGEWRAEIVQADRRGGRALVQACTAAQSAPPDLWLLFSPIRKERMAFIVEKAVELGVRRLQPVRVRRSRPERLRPEKLRAYLVEAAEQCGALSVPELAAPMPLAQLLTGWPAERSLVFCDTGLDMPTRPTRLPPAPAAVLIGPEGGFDAAERAAIRAHPACRPLALGPRILRAETAALAALTLWQAHAGDWR